MNFKLSEEMKLLKDMAYDFAKNELEPLAQICDEEEKYDASVVKKAAEAGLLGSWIPEEYGGAGVGSFGLAIITEQLSRVDMGAGLNVVGSSFGCEALHLYGSEELKTKYLPPICKGEMVSAGAYTEPNAGTDVAGYQTRAVKDGNDYVINGNKMFITNGTVCDFYIVQCITHPDEKRHGRFSMILVPAKTPGIKSNKIKGKMGIRASDTAEVSFENVKVPISNLIGKEKKGFYQLMHFFDTTRPMVAAQGLGLAQGCLDESIKYAKERSAFGSPIINFQLIQAKIAEMAIRIESLRGLTYKAAWDIDHGSGDYTLAAMAKYHSGETAVFCANAAVEIHGGYGYINEYKVQKFYRDAKILELYEGTKEAEIMTICKAIQG